PLVSSSAYALAREQYAALDAVAVAELARLSGIPVSLHCWRGDAVSGFENPGVCITGGGIQAAGHYACTACTTEELRADLDLGLSRVPGKHRLNLHASYAEFGGRKVERNEVDVTHFESWIQWAKTRGLGLDFNPTYFSHPLAN